MANEIYSKDGHQGIAYQQSPSKRQTPPNKRLHLTPLRCGYLHLHVIEGNDSTATDGE
jgi:hypothetical protein